MIDVLKAINFSWKCIYFILPSAFANMAPVFFRKVPFLDCPVDFGANWKGKPIFGNHKTFRGFFFGILLSILVVYIQSRLSAFQYFRNISLVAYSEYNFVLLGFLLGFGALFGDLIESFVKRRRGINAGKRWVPWDQLDFIVGSIIFVSFVYLPPWQVITFLLIATPLLHIALKHIGYYLHISRAKW